MSTVTRKRTNLGGGKYITQTTTSGPNGTKTTNSSTQKFGKNTTTYNEKTGKTRRTTNNGNGSSTISTTGGWGKPPKVTKSRQSKSSSNSATVNIENMDLGILIKVIVWGGGIILALWGILSLLIYVSSLFH